MSYSEEQTRAYNILMYKFEDFERIKKAISKNKCPIHNKRVKVNSSWEQYYEIHVFVSDYCCEEFAKEMIKPFIDEQTFNCVYIDKGEDGHEILSTMENDIYRAPNPPASNVMNLKELALDFFKLILNGKVTEAFAQYISEDFVHHNPVVKGNKEALKSRMNESYKKYPDRIVVAKQIIQDTNRVVVYLHLKQNAEDIGTAFVYILHFNGENLIDELWVNAMKIPENIINENGVF